MKTIIRINPLTNPNWDQFVCKNPYGSFVHLSNWQQVLQTSFPNMEGYYLAVVDEGQRILAGLPLYHVSSWFTGNRLVSIPFANFSDPLATHDYDFQLLLKAALDLAQELGAEHIEIKLRKYPQPAGNDRWLKTVNYQTHTIQLSRPIEKLFAEFHKCSIQKKIKRTTKSNLVLRMAQEEKDWRAFYEIYLSHRRHRGLPPQPYAFFQALFQNFHNTGILQLFLVEMNNTIVGGMYVFCYRQTMLADTLATRDDLKEQNLPIFLYWQAIRSAYDQNCREFNFGRTSITNQGLLDHKSKWATEVENLTELLYINRNAGKSSRREESLLYNSARLILRKAPMFAYKFLGNIAYKHIG